MTTNRIVLWQIHDDRPGHHNQLRGLTSALAALMPLEVHAIRAPSRASCLASLWSKNFAAGTDLPAPDLIVGAGHSTHLAVLAARRAYGGQAIVLMKPSLLPALFDLCFVPEHDGVAESLKVATTRGVLNVVRPSSNHDDREGLMLIGGPSSAHGWSDRQMLDQVASVVSGDATIQWRLTTSRRTPDSFAEQVAKLDLDNLEVTSHQQTTPEWLPKQLARAGQTWVSEDSVSMVYEALTSGTAVGIFAVPSKRRGRVVAGLDALVHDGWATKFVDWRSGSRLTSPPEQLDESRRCADIICQRLLAKAA